MRFGHVLLTTFFRRPNTAAPNGNGSRPAEDPLRHQWRLFAELTVPSVAAQSESGFTWVINCRPDSPEWLRALADTIRIGPDVHFSFASDDPFLDKLTDGSADALIVTRIRPASSLHLRAIERIREDCEADPYTSQAVTLTDGYLLDRAARRMRPYQGQNAPLSTTISLEPARGLLSRSARSARPGRNVAARSISEGDPMFVLLAPGKPRPGPAARPLDGRWLATRPTADILDREFGLVLVDDDDRGPAGPRLSRRAVPASKPGWLSAPPGAPDRQKVVVSIPCFQAWGSLARAVDSVLDQTHKDLLVIVANDGDDQPHWDVLDHVRDPRVVRVDYETNRGRYFADQTALMARLGQYLLVHGADEWSEPGRVQTLLEGMRREHGVAAVSPRYQHRAGAAAPATVVTPALPGIPVTRRYSDAGGWPGYQALFDARGLLRVGGCYSGYRLEYDNFLLHVLRMTGAVVRLDRPLYHQADRSAGPQQDDPAYFDPEVRRSASAAYARLYTEAYHLYCEYLQGLVGYHVLCQQLRSIAWRHVSTSDWSRLRAGSSRLRWLAGAGRSSASRDGLGTRAPARTLAGAQSSARLMTRHTTPAGVWPPGTMPASSRVPRSAPPVVTGILTARSQADLAPDAITHALLPHDATVMVDRTGADLVLIEAAAMLPGNAWAYAANPSAAARSRRLADLIDVAHADGKPVIFLRNLPRDQMVGMRWLDALCDVVVDGDLGVQLARFNPIDLPARRPSYPLYLAGRDAREPIRQRRLLDQLTSGRRQAVCVADVPWPELPAWYRRRAVFLAASASQAGAQRACGARVIAPFGSDDGVMDTPAAMDAAVVTAQLDAARAAGVPPMTEVRQVLREIFLADATPVRLAAIARQAGQRTDVSSSRQITVLAAVEDAMAAEKLAHQLLRQRLRPAEVVVALGSAQPAAVGHTPARSDEVGRALTVLAEAGITVRVAIEESDREAARRARLPWIAPWDGQAGHSDWYLLDLACARECSEADVIGTSRYADYVFTDTAKPALLRRDLLVPGGPPQRSWSRRGIRMLSITS